MKRAFLALVLALSFFFKAIPAKAYDEDTHFYATYAMARYAGIGHEVSSKLALGAQWMDEAYGSDPLSMILDVLQGAKKRRLLHFPANEMAGDFVTQSLFGYKLFSMTVPNHPIASELINEGLKEGNLMKAAASLHVLEDSYAHAGTTSQFGHSMYGHWPDRPFASIPKYYEMIKTVFKAMVAIREMLPENLLDKDVTGSTGTPNYQLDAETLASTYSNLWTVRKTVEKNVLKDPEYVKFAVKYIFERAYKQTKFLNKGLDLNKDIYPWIESYKFDGKKDVRQALKEISINVIVFQESQKNTQKHIFNFSEILSNTGLKGDVTEEYRLSMGGAERLLDIAIEELTQGIVPKELTDYNKFEAEEEGPVRQKEMAMRMRNMEDLIEHLYGIRIRFVPNSTKDDKGFLSEVLEKKEQLIPSTVNEVHLSYTAQEKYDWDHMIFHFIFPSLKSYQFKELYLTGMGAVVAHPFYVVKAGYLLKLAWNDIKTSHITPQPDNMYYQFPELLRKMKAQGIYKPLVTAKQAQDLVYEPFARNQARGLRLDKTGILYSAAARNLLMEKP